MKVAFFDAHDFEVTIFEEKNKLHNHELNFLSTTLSPKTASLAKDFPAICAFANDDLGGKTLRVLSGGGTKLIALRSAGFNHVDLKAAAELPPGICKISSSKRSPR